METTHPRTPQEAPQTLTDTELNHARNAAMERVSQASEEAHWLALESIARIARGRYPDACSISVFHDGEGHDFSLRDADGTEYDIWAEDATGECFGDTGAHEELHQLAAILYRINWVHIEQTYLFEEATR